MNELQPDPETEALAEALRKEYPAVRVLPDGSIAAISPLLTTTAVVMGCTRDGWAKRYCFESSTRAFHVLADLQSEDDEPTGWIARRP